MYDISTISLSWSLDEKLPRSSLLLRQQEKVQRRIAPPRCGHGRAMVMKKRCTYGWVEWDWGLISYNPLLSPNRWAQLSVDFFLGGDKALPMPPGKKHQEKIAGRKKVSGMISHHDPLHKAWFPGRRWHWGVGPFDFHEGKSAYIQSADFGWWPSVIASLQLGTKPAHNQCPKFLHPTFLGLPKLIGIAWDYYGTIWAATKSWIFDVHSDYFADLYGIIFFNWDFFNHQPKLMI